MNIINIVTYITINLLLFSSWYFFLFKNKDYLSFTDRLIGTFILSLTQIIFTEMLLGVVFKKLYAMPLFLLNISISSCVLILALKQRQQTTSYLKDIFIELKNKINWFFSVIKADLVLLCIFGLFLMNLIEDKWIDRTRELLGRFWWFGIAQEKFKVVYSDEIYKVVRFIK